jgi:hypothetical protein
MSTNREADDLSSYSKVTGGLYVRAAIAVKLFSRRRTASALARYRPMG